MRRLTPLLAALATATAAVVTLGFAGGHGVGALHALTPGRVLTGAGAGRRACQAPGLSGVRCAQ